jgi:dTDP-4-amino-4,6-dideoxygalactose transaminase
MINVTKPYMPAYADYEHYLKGIWERGWLTNHGPLVLELEAKLKEYLGVKHLFFLNNGTIALQIAIKALEVKGEVITTPFSYVATTSSLVWENCTPVFADIEPTTLTLDPAAVEAAITPATTAIMATHVYGNPCDVEAFQAIAKKHNLRIIYDGAHAFGVKYKGGSVLNYGDITTLSFHATKLFHTVEGGAVITDNDELAHKLSYLRNFGHNGPEKFFGFGINGKSSEFHAAMGLCVLPHVNDIIVRRKEICALYDSLLQDKVRILQLRPETTYNYAYYPVLFPSEEKLLAAVQLLQANQITPRRYFYPSLNTLDYVQYQACPVSEDVAKRVLCLPLFIELKDEEVRLIADLISSAM